MRLHPSRRAGRAATVTAIEPMRTISLVSWDFKPILDNEPEVAKALLKVLCARIRASGE